ncbi:MAG: zinc-ribbon domain-containing protein [Patescibacteria group bacterium]|jgi:CxxC-x17-CxxC domain-containing protein
MTKESKFEDQVLNCKDCGDKFIWTEGEQQFYYDKGLKNIPKRCKPCAEKFKSELREKHPMQWIKCKKCHKKAEVPFEPKSEDTLCEECFNKEIEKRNRKIIESGLQLPQ